MTTQQAPIAKFLIVFAAFVIVVSGLKMASSLVVPFLLGSIYRHDCLAFISLAKATTSAG
jgi:hypothetical protein